MLFRLEDGVDLDDGRAVVHTFFRQLMQAFPKGEKVGKRQKRRRAGSQTTSRS